ncbi:ssDNA endodeoxyribonuclease [Serendipita sp. 396]|nr:ssDNA endodeoxyribonuclease [Serendipita sp. 396]
MPSVAANESRNDDPELILLASLLDVAPFVALLKALNGLSDTASIIITKAGIRVEVEYKRALQATAYLANSLFESFVYNPSSESNDTEEEIDEGDTSTEIEINLSILNEALSIYGSGGGFWKRKERNDPDQQEDEDEVRGPLDRFFGRKTAVTSLRMSYIGDGHPLRLILAERAEGPTTVCQIHTLVPERRMGLPFDDEEKIVKIIMRSSWLRDTLAEIDTSCDYVTIICNPPQKVACHGKGPSSRPNDSFFRIDAKTSKGGVEIDFPNDREVLEHFECGQSLKFHYSFDFVHKMIRALAVSVKVSIRIDSEGTMSLQFLMPSGTSKERTTWMEYRCLPREENV